MDVKTIFGGSNNQGNLSFDVNCLASPSAGNLFVSDRMSEKVYLLNARTMKQRVVKEGPKMETNVCIAVGHPAELYICSSTSNSIKMILEGREKHFAGSLESKSGFVDDNDLAKCMFNAPEWIAFDHSKQYMFVADTGNHRLRVITMNPSSSGRIQSVGSGKKASEDGPGKSSAFYEPHWVGFPPKSSLWYSDHVFIAEKGKIRLVNEAANVVTLVGKDSTGFRDGKLTDALLGSKLYGAFGTNGDLFISDQQNHVIRHIEADSIIKTLCGNPTSTSNLIFQDGSLQNAQFGLPSSLTWDGSSGDLIVCDRGCNRIRKIRDVLKPRNCHFVTAPLIAPFLNQTFDSSNYPYLNLNNLQDPNYLTLLASLAAKMVCVFLPFTTHLVKAVFDTIPQNLLVRHIYEQKSSSSFPSLLDQVFTVVRIRTAYLLQYAASCEFYEMQALETHIHTQLATLSQEQILDLLVSIPSVFPMRYQLPTILYLMADAALPVTSYISKLSRKTDPVLFSKSLKDKLTQAYLSTAEAKKDEAAIQFYHACVSKQIGPNPEEPSTPASLASKVWLLYQLTMLYYSSTAPSIDNTSNPKLNRKSGNNKLQCTRSPEGHANVEMKSEWIKMEQLSSSSSSTKQQFGLRNSSLQLSHCVKPCDSPTCYLKPNAELSLPSSQERFKIHDWVFCIRWPTRYIQAHLDQMVQNLTEFQPSNQKNDNPIEKINVPPMDLPEICFQNSQVINAFIHYIYSGNPNSFTDEFCAIAMFESSESLGFSDEFGMPRAESYELMFQLHKLVSSTTRMVPGQILGSDQVLSISQLKGSGNVDTDGGGNLSKKHKRLSNSRPVQQPQKMDKVKSNSTGSSNTEGADQTSASNQSVPKINLPEPAQRADTSTSKASPLLRPKLRRIAQAKRLYLDLSAIKIDNSDASPDHSPNQPAPPALDQRQPSPNRVDPPSSQLSYSSSQYMESTASSSASVQQREGKQPIHDHIPPQPSKTQSRPIKRAGNAYDAFASDMSKKNEDQCSIQ